MGSSASQPTRETNQNITSGTNCNNNNSGDSNRNRSEDREPSDRPTKRTRTNSNDSSQDQNSEVCSCTNENSQVRTTSATRTMRFSNNQRRGSFYEEDIQSLSNNLEELERGLNENHGIAFRSTDPNHESSSDRRRRHYRSGRALFESIGSALGNIRERLHELTGSSVSSNNESTEIGSSSAPSNTRQVSLPEEESLRALSQRLDTAELSHSTRMPLNLLQMELSRRTLSTETSTSGSSGVPRADAVVSSVSTPDRGASRAESHEYSSIEVASAGSNRRRVFQRQPSALLASRSRDDVPTLDFSERQSSMASLSSIGNLSDASFASERDLVASTRTMIGSSMPTVHERPSIDDEGIEVSIELGGRTDYDDDSRLLLPDSARKHEFQRPSMRKSLSILGDDVVRQLVDANEEEEGGNIDDDQNTSHVPAIELYTWGTLQFRDSADEDGKKEGGSNDASYQLFGASDNDEASAEIPRRIPPDSRLGRADIVSMSASATHCAFATASGRLLICGSNQRGAVDPSQRDSLRIPRPTHLETGLGMNRIKKVSCGINHTAVITETKSVLTWGFNGRGQLGHRGAKRSNSTSFVFPNAFILGTGGRRAENVTCCDGYTLVLTTRMEAFLCGNESVDGEGLSEDDDRFFPLPQQISVLRGLPLVGIASGVRHMVVWTAHGTAYAWGSNEAGQCGREFPREIKIPVPIGVPKSSQTPIPSSINSAIEHSNSITSFLNNWRVWERGEPMSISSDAHIVDAACGKDHTILVTESGSLLVCGSSSNGQLGQEIKSHGDPVKVQVLAHPDPQRKFQSVKAGTNHTLILDDNGSIWQMGNGHSSIRRTPSLPLPGSGIISIAAGGSVNFAILKPKNAESTQMPTQSIPELDDLMNAIRSEHEDKKDPSNQSASSQQEGRTINYHGSIEDLTRGTENLFRSPAAMNSLFVDPNEIDQMYQSLIYGSHNHEMRQKIVSAIERGMRMGLKSMADSRFIYFESVRFLLLYLQCPLWRDKAIHNNEEVQDEPSIKFDVRGDLIFLLCETILALPFEGYKALLAWCTLVYGEKLYVPLLVKPLVQQLNHRFSNNITHGIPIIAGVLRCFHTVNERCDGALAKSEDFYCSGIDDMLMEALYDDLAQYHRATHTERSSNFFLAGHPFLMAPAVKQRLLQVESQMSMIEAAQAGGVSFDAATREYKFEPYFVLMIDRKYLLTQTLQVVAKASAAELRKGLKVVFKGEDGVDAGGVTKEFFQLLCEQLFDVNTGMWTTNFGNHNDNWFNSDCTWNAEGYYLVGILCGLAVYNSVFLDVHFPHAVYRKLLGLPLGLEDLVDEDVRKGLKSLLEYEGDDAEHVFCLNYEVSWMDLGQERKKELKPGGSEIAVTSENKDEYVMLYVKWLLVDSIASQYGEFEKGFNQVMEDSSLDILNGDELELLVTGTPELDFVALEKSTEYEGGFDADTAVVQHIWKWVQSANQPTQKKFLKFCTGSSKGPIGGLGNMPFKIQRAGPDSLQLPTAHTCFNTLIVPDYGDDYDKLSERLGRAVIECEGFGLQ